MYVKLKFPAHWLDPPDRQNSVPVYTISFQAKFRTKITVILTVLKFVLKFLLDSQGIILHGVLHSHQISSIRQLNILLVSHHMELPALFLKVGVGRLVIK